MKKLLPGTWYPMIYAPKDGTNILLGLWVNNAFTKQTHWEMYVAGYCPEYGEAVEQDGGYNLPWQWEDFDAFMLIPEVDGEQFDKRKKEKETPVFAIAGEEIKPGQCVVLKDGKLFVAK